MKYLRGFLAEAQSREDADSYVKDNKKDKTLDFINNNSKDFIEFKLSFYNEDLKDEDKKVNTKSPKKNNKLIPETNINENQVRTINIV